MRTYYSIIESLKKRDKNAYVEFMNAFNVGYCKKGEILHDINKVSKELYIIKSGIIKQFRHKEDGSEYITWFGFPGDPMSAYKSFVRGIPSREGLSVIEDCEYYYIPRDTCYELQDKYHAIMAFFHEMLEEYAIALESRMYFLLALSAKQKYRFLQDKLPHFIQRIPQHELALFLGVTRETLSRIRKHI